MGTNIAHPCRGTLSTCTIPEKDNLTHETKRPCSTSCWRLAFRFHQEECKATKGFMIQVEEEQGLGDGQKIETEMAKQMGLKLFRTYTNDDVVEYAGPLTAFHYKGIEAISKAVQEWYAAGCVNPDLENVFIGDQKSADTPQTLDRFSLGVQTRDRFSYSVRPRYEKF